MPLATAALQFWTRDKRIASTIVGMSEAKRIDQTLALDSIPIPEALWAALNPLITEGRTGD